MSDDNQQIANLHKLLQVIGVNASDWQLMVSEALGSLVLMLHWQRGIIDALIQNGNITLNETQLNNWNRVIKDLELYESIVWEIAPSRAMLLQLRHFRKTGELEPGFELLTKTDTHGRIAYGLTDKQLDDIEDIIRKIKDARQLTGIPTYGHANKLGIDPA